MIDIKFSRDLQLKLLRQEFALQSRLESSHDVEKWRDLWSKELRHWHSPYKALIDCTHLETVSPDPTVRDALDRMLRFFRGFFLRDVAGYSHATCPGHGALPFRVWPAEAEACASIGLRVPSSAWKPGGDSIRDQIAIENDFRQRLVEVSFRQKVTLAGDAEIEALRSKLTNNLGQWHSSWSLLFDCSQLEIAAEAIPAYLRMERFLKGFFLCAVAGYNPSVDSGAYPFETKRSRHAAVAALGLTSHPQASDEANCASRRADTPGEQPIGEED